MFHSKSRPSVEPHEKWMMYAFLAYSVVYTISFVINGLTGMLQDLRLSHLDHELRFLTIVPIFFLFRSLRLSQQTLWVSILLGAAISGGYALMSFFWIAPGERVSGSYHSIAFGDISLTLAFMSIPAFNWLKSKHVAFRLMPFAAFFLAMVAVLLSKTRGSWIAIPSLVVIMFFYTAPILKIGTRIVCLCTIFLLLIAAYHTPVFNLRGRVEAAVDEVIAYSNGNRSYSSIGTRLEGWQVALDIFRESPVIGAGPGNYEPRMNRMIEKGKSYKIAVIHSQPHGAYPSAMADCGFLGLLALLCLFIFPLVSATQLIRRSNPMRHFGYALMILVVSFMHFGMTETIFSLNINVTYYIILTASILAVAANKREGATSTVF